jgi:hypothetical protein
MSFVLILPFVLNGHVHTVDTERTFSSRQECSVAGQQAKSYANPGARSAIFIFLPAKVTGRHARPRQEPSRPL